MRWWHVQLLLSCSLAIALACVPNSGGGTAQPVEAEPGGAEPVATAPTVFVEAPPEPKRAEPEPSSPAPVEHVDHAAREQAKLLFVEAVELYEAGDIAAAIEKFEQAYALAPMPALLFNIARGREQLGDVAGACATYERAQIDPQADASMRDVATQRLAQLNCP